MAANPKLLRWWLFAGAGLLFVVAFVIAAGVILPVRADQFPHATPELAVRAFWVVVALNLLTGTAVLLIAIKTTIGGSIVRVVLAVLAILILLFGLVLSDAAFALYGHGVGMRVADIFLFACVAADLGACLLVGATAVRCP